MTRIQLTINGTTRRIDALQYEYFNPVCKSEKKYRKTLQKNFPYDFGDDTDLFPYSTVALPTLTTDALAKRLSDEAKWETRIYDPSFRSASLFREIKSKKDFYYDRLTELRYDKGLDRDIIPNIHYLYDMETRPSNSWDFPDMGRFIGGIFELEFDSTDDDDFFYQWLLSGTMNNGEMVFYKGDHEDQFIKIKFWDCYCIEIEERMSSVDYSPMKMKIRISPAITENRGIKHEKSWKVTEIVNKPFKPEPYAPSVPLVKAVKGKTIALLGEKVEYKVTAYNLSNVSENDRKRVKWIVQIDEKREKLKECGESILLNIPKEWLNKEITVMPYLQTPTTKVCEKTKVRCKHVDGAITVAEYIVNEIKINTRSQIANSIRYWTLEEEYQKRYEEWKNNKSIGKFLNPPEPQNLLKAKVLWTERVFAKRPWDHKPKIRDKFCHLAVERTHPQTQVVYKSYYHKYKDYDYYYDVWSNIHYGYIGLSVGFDENTLLNGADLAQIIDSKGRNAEDTGDDKTAIKIGFNLYYKYGRFAENLSAQDILDALDAAIMTESKLRHICFAK